MHFVLTTIGKEDMPSYIKNISYRYIDVNEMLNLFRLQNCSIDEESKYFSIHFNIFIQQKLKNCLKNYKTDYFIYKVPSLNKVALTNIYNLVYDKYNHKIKKFIVLDSNENLDKIITPDLDIYYIEYVENTDDSE